MKTKLFFKINIAVAMIVFLLGAYWQTKSTPGQLGLHRAQIDDTGLLELAIDQIREGLRTGNTQMLREAMTTQLFNQSVSKRENSAFGAENSKVNDTFESGALHFLPKINMRTSEIAYKDGRAEVKGTLTLDANSDTKVEMTFTKEKSRWKLADATGLFENLVTEAEPKLNSDTEAEQSAYEIYRDSGTDNLTLVKRALSEDNDIPKLTKTVTEQKLNRQLFQNPCAGVLFSSVMQSDHAPYFTARYVQLVTDPAWNRVVYGDYDGWIKAYHEDGAGKTALNHPHGIDRDSDGNVYIADTGNNRVVVLRLAGVGADTKLQYQFDFGTGEVSLPYDVAWDDAGTPFEPADDIIWVVDTGHHRILGYAVNENEMTLKTIYGKSGNAAGEFFGPKTIAVGRFNGVCDGTLYVGDSGNRRLVKLAMDANHLLWVDTFKSKDESQFTAIDVDHWGNVYATDRSYREVLKLTSGLKPVVTVKGENNAIVDPTDFRVIFGRVYIESENKNYWAGYDQAVTLEKWSETSGAERYELGIDLANYKVSLSRDLDRVYINSTLTEHGNLTAAIIDANSETTVRQIPAGWLIPGDKQIAWERRDDLGWQVEPGLYRIQLSAESAYGKAERFKETTDFYLPLYYHEDSGAEIQRDAHLIQGERSTEWGALPDETIAKHPSEVVYRFAGLNPAVDYELKAEFLYKVGDYLKQSIKVDETNVLDALEVTAESKQVEWMALPRETYSDGEIDVRIVKLEGECDAMISQLWLREAGYDPEHPPLASAKNSAIPQEYSLNQNYPNPFNPMTTIEFGVPAGAAGKVTLRVYNMLGQTVNVLVNEQLPPGRHSLVWNGRDAFNRQVASGVYFYQLRAGNFTEVRKMIMMK